MGRRWWGMLAVAVQNALASTLVDDAPHLLHGWEGEGPPLAVLLHGDAPAQRSVEEEEGQVGGQARTEGGRGRPRVRESFLSFLSFGEREATSSPASDVLNIIRITFKAANEKT